MTEPKSSSLGRGRALFLVVSLCLLLPLLVGGTLAARSQPSEDSLFRHLTVLGDVLGLVQQAYVEPAETQELMVGALAGAVEALDPFSIFVGREHTEVFSRAYRPDRRYGGMQVLAERGLVFVAGVEDGSPAAKAGIRRGDLVSKVAGRSTRGLPQWDIWTPLAAEQGKVELELLRLGDPELVTIELGPSAAAPAVTVTRGEGAAVVRPHRFDAAAVADLRAALVGLAADGVGAMVLDLTGVFVGDPAQGWDAAALFVDGDLGSIVHRETTLTSRRSDVAPVWTGKLVVATDHGTQGPAEVLLASLAARDIPVVGQPSFGWAGRGEVIELPGGDRVVLTTSWFAGPDGEKLSSSLEPTVEVDERARLESEAERPFAEIILRRAQEEIAKPVEVEAEPALETAA